MKTTAMGILVSVKGNGKIVNYYFNSEKDAEEFKAYYQTMGVVVGNYIMKQEFEVSEEILEFNE